jgi:nitroreductase
VSEPEFKPLVFERRDPATMSARAAAWRAEIVQRRSVRHFSPEPIPRGVLLDCIRAAASAPSGANKQPWTFVVVTDPDVKCRIREAAEEEERDFYENRAPDYWLDDLRNLGTDADKKYLEIAPALIVVFAQRYGLTADEHNYYVAESVGIAVGFLLAALHHAGLATLTHTPSPMKFLLEIMARPRNERPYMLIPVGLPADDCQVPVIQKKALDDVLIEV